LEYDFEMATNNNFGEKKIHILTERNYDSWFIRMGTILRSQYLWEFVTVGYLEVVDQEA
jgi:hypothetical protein